MVLIILVGCGVAVCFAAGAMWTMTVSLRLDQLEERVSTLECAVGIKDEEDEPTT